MTAQFWTCLNPGCDESGETTATESGADQKHVKAERHSTMTTTRRDWAEGWK